MSSAARTAKWRENNPDKVRAYKQSEQGKQVCRDATARWRARNPKPKTVLLPLTAYQQEEKIRRKRAVYMRAWKANTSGFLPCFDFPPPPDDNRCFNCGEVAKLHMDHCHATGKYRGYLCIGCNMGIGQLGDTIEGLERALAYLEGKPDMALTLIANLDPGLQCRNTLNAVIDLVGANHPWTANNIPFTDATGDFAQDNSFFWDNTLKDLHIGGAYYVNAARALYVVPHVSGNNWFEGSAGNATLTGYGNFGTGDQSLLSTTTGYANVALGANALQYLTDGFENMAMGSNALLLTRSDKYNVAIGTNALRGLGDFGTGGGSNQSNIAIGFGAAGNMRTGAGNIAIGFSALSNVVYPGTASFNTILGNQAAGSLGLGGSSPNTNTFLGTSSGQNLTAGQNNVWLGGHKGPAGYVEYTIAISDGSGGRLMDYSYTTNLTWSMNATIFNEPNGLHIYGWQDAVPAATNWERAILDWKMTANVFRIGTQKGGSGTLRLLAIDGFAKAGAPAAADVPASCFAVIDDTSAGQTWLVFNKAGVIRKVQLA